MTEKMFYLTEKDRNTIKQFLDIQKRQNSFTRSVAPDNHLQGTTEVYIAKANGSIPAVTETATGTGTDYSPHSLLCNIYLIEMDTGLLKPVSDIAYPVYNLGGSTVSAGWVLIHREKYGKWVCGLGGSSTSSGGGGATYFGQCNCYNCITPAQATVTVAMCSNCPDGAPFTWLFNPGTYVYGYSELGGDHYLIWDSGCVWKGDLVSISTGTGTGTGTSDDAVYQWVFTIGATPETTSVVLTYISGPNILDL